MKENIYAIKLQIEKIKKDNKLDDKGKYIMSKALLEGVYVRIDDTIVFFEPDKLLFLDDDWFDDNPFQAIGPTIICEVAHFEWRHLHMEEHNVEWGLSKEDLIGTQILEQKKEYIKNELREKFKEDTKQTEFLIDSVRKSTISKIVTIVLQQRNHYEPSDIEYNAIDSVVNIIKNIYK